MKLEKSIVWRGHRWTEMFREDNKYMRQDGYDVILRRTTSVSELNRYGQAVGGIDAKLLELTGKYPRLAGINADKLEYAPRN
jgi:hypothetical protein